MKPHHTVVLGLIPIMITALPCPAGGLRLPAWITTNVGSGADAEVRESSPTTNRGASTELASRVLNNFISGNASDGNDRQSLIYTRFDLSPYAIPDTFVTAFRLTYRNNSLNGSRIQDTVTPNPALRTGLAVWGLNNPALGNWSENTITYLSAPGITFDGDVGTRDVNSDLTFLGTVLFPPIGTQNRLPVGGELIFSSATLDTFVNNAVEGGASSITLVAAVIHGGDSPFPVWRNFNYLFNPKEQTTLNSDPGYDADITDLGNPLGSPHSGADNTLGQYSPGLKISSVVLPDLSITQVREDEVDFLIEKALPGITFTLESSQGFTAWSTLDTLQSTWEPSPFTTPRPLGLSKSFYRLRR